MTRIPDTPELQQHAQALATAFGLRLIETPQLRPDEAFALPHLKLALVSTIVDDTTYAVALHELGHLAAPTGAIRGAVEGDRASLQRVEEDAAWAWARHYALHWTDVMDRVARWAEGTYQTPRAPQPAPTAPVAPNQHIDWKNWK
jgi:hypothetical protein